MKAVYTALLQRPQAAIAPLVASPLQRIASGASRFPPEITRLVRTVNDQYAGDVGVFATVFFMNFVKLARGEAVYIGAHEAHAYLAGDIIECMAVPDNVLNVAFVAPAERRTADFVRALTFTARSEEHWRLSHARYAKSKTGKTQAYDPPLEEFVVLGTALKQGETETLAAVDGPTLGIVTSGKMKVSVDGEALTLDEGSICWSLGPTPKFPWRKATEVRCGGQLSMCDPPSYSTQRIFSS